MTTTCAHCDTPVLQVTGVLTGGTFVVDATPDPSGEYAVSHAAGHSYARVWTSRRPVRAGEQTHRSHADTCTATAAAPTGTSSELYDVLGVAPGASRAEIRQAFRRLARALHPDVNPRGAETFKQVTRAYDHLTRSEVAA